MKILILEDKNGNEVRIPVHGDTPDLSHGLLKVVGYEESQETMSDEVAQSLVNNETFIANVLSALPDASEETY